eukprot:TRINITY_DN2001_c0_g2_i1.p1 TRINITY_DN2001_c0_g2~~TRINITY_DN2001_c0_g2_i1.p1  ORF type:complete len:360 (-),score=58.50 TRINITY_DN2001_c0_g2_i1:517-1506(-)
MSAPGSQRSSFSEKNGVGNYLVVVGSANADLYMEVDRLPKLGETVSARTGQTLPGGKGANQAACAARLGYPTYFVGQVGKDGQATLLREALAGCGVRLDHLGTVAGPTGQAVVMLQPGGGNSIIVLGGANVAWPRREGGILRMSDGVHALIKHASAVLLQREVPDYLNIEAAKAARSANVPVLLDVGGIQAPLGADLLKYITIISPNETELARLTSMPTDTMEEVLAAAAKVQEMGVQQVLVKLGEKGSVFVSASDPPIHQEAVLAPVCVDTTGAGDTFMAAFAVALGECKSRPDALRFAATAASLSVRSKGAIPSMPDRASVMRLLEE